MAPSPSRELAREAHQNKSYGESFIHDPQFRGPLAKRGCTDVLCLLFFFVFLIAFGFAGYYAQREGDLNRLLVPRDSDGLQCGQDSEVIDKKFLVFFDLSKCADPLVPINGCPTPQTCVEECPSTTFLHSRESCNKENIDTYKSKLICMRNVDKRLIRNCDDIEEYIQSNKCAKYYLKSEPFFNHCLSDLLPLNYECSVKMYQQNRNRFPRLASEDVNYETDADMKCERVDPAKRKMLIEKFEIAESYLSRFIGNILKHFTDERKVQEMGQLIVEDTINTWPVLAVGFGLAAFSSLIIIAIMRWVAGPIVWLSIIGVLGLLSAGTFVSYRQYDYYKKNPVERYNLQPNLRSIINSYFVEANTWLYILIGTAIILTVIALLVIVFRKRIVIAIALIKEGSKAVSTNLTTILFPIFPWILQACVIFLSILMFLYLASIGVPKYKIAGMKEAATCICTGNYSTIQDGDVCNPTEFNQLCKDTRFPGASCVASCHYIGLQAPQIATYFKVINVVGFFWLLFFISAFAEMVMAGTFACWYWTLNKDDVPFFTLTRSLYRTIRFHLGTLAFGALILTICRIIRLVLEYIDRKLKKFDNELTKAVLCCCRCFFWCLENFLKFMNRNAYIMCAIHGKHFCASARDAFNLLMRNVLRVIALDKTTDFLFFLSKLLISLGVSACTFTYLSSELFNQHFPYTLMHYPLAQVFFIFVGSYVIASVFFGVYSMAVDTLFLCFLEDCERNDGSPDRPYFMSKQLMKILKKSNKP